MWNISLLAELRNLYDVDNNTSETEIIKLYKNVDLLEFLKYYDKIII